MAQQAVLQNMALVRVISGLLELGAAVLIFRLGRVDTALRINALLGLVGPVIFMLVSALGVVALTVKLSWPKLGLLILGIILIVWGSKS
jgi:hypothetical protein